MNRSLLIIAVLLISACTENKSSDQPNTPNQFDVEIRWTSYGIPHVKADDWGSLGYGFAYATAKDAICTIARDMIMVRGEQSRYFGTEDKHRNSDIFHKAMLTDAIVEASQAAVDDKNSQFTTGYVKGYNRYLKDNIDRLPDSCAGQPWVKTISEADVARLGIGVGIRYGVGRFQKNIAEAVPLRPAVELSATNASRYDGIGSNAVALGSDVTESGRGMLFGNPHYPWKGSSRFHMIHTTIPGEVDVMGVGLTTTMRVAIGFNQDIAWTHTVSTALRATVYQLELNPANSMQYKYDEEMRDIETVHVELISMDDEGQPVTSTHTVYLSHYGPILASKQMPWSTTHAYTVRDVNMSNFQTTATYHRLNSATSIKEVEAAISEQGVSFTNTIAADRHGTALFADISRTPNVDADLIDRCRVKPEGLPNYIVVLNGSNSSCEWQDDPRSKSPGLLPPQEMPRIKRSDYVTNSNDSYWLSNPQAPLEGYSPIIGPEKTARTWRTRAGITLVEDLIGKGKITPDQIQNMLYEHRNYAAEVLLDDVVKVCDIRMNKDANNIADACGVLKKWDRRQTIQSRGAQVWTEFWRAVRSTDNLYGIAFDPQDPIYTPRGINVLDRDVLKAVHAALVTAQTTLAEANIPLDAPWGEIQFAERHNQRIPIPGGQGWAGMFSMIVADLKKDKGYTPIVHGNSYVQVISWDEDGTLDARGILTYSQSEEPDSPHYSDQTELYSQSQWLKFPFTESEIASDPNLVSLRLTE
ncbi:MAG: penicillin acylase family protein [bacterium]